MCLIEDGCVICRATCRVVTNKPLSMEWDDARAPVFRDAKAQTVEASIPDLIRQPRQRLAAWVSEGFPNQVSARFSATALRVSLASYPNIEGEIFYRLSMLPCFMLM